MFCVFTTHTNHACRIAVEAHNKTTKTTKAKMMYICSIYFVLLQQIKNTIVALQQKLRIEVPKTIEEKS
jgi:hypothetical protein